MSALDRAVDDFFDNTTQVIRKNFSYVECTDCHHLVELYMVHDLDLHEWKFSIMGLRPSILSVAKGLCPTCQDMRKQFKGIIEK